MIGRTDERALIGGLLADARSGRSATLVLSGPPGVGKSVLLAHAVDLAVGMRSLPRRWFPKLGIVSRADLARLDLETLLVAE